MEDGFEGLGVMINQNTPNFVLQWETRIGRFTFYNGRAT